MNSRLFLGTMAFAVIATAGGLTASADPVVNTTTTQTVKSTAVPGAMTVMPGPAVSTTVTTDEGADTTAIPADEDGITTATSTETVPAAKAVVTTTTTDKTITSAVPSDTPVVAPAVKGHKAGDKTAARKHSATGSDETSTAGDKAAKAVTPLTESSIPADAKVEHKSDGAITH